MIRKILLNELYKNYYYKADNVNQLLDEYYELWQMNEEYIVMIRRGKMNKDLC